MYLLLLYDVNVDQLLFPYHKNAINFILTCLLENYTTAGNCYVIMHNPYVHNGMYNDYHAVYITNN